MAGGHGADSCHRSTDWAGVTAADGGVASRPSIACKVQRSTERSERVAARSQATGVVEITTNLGFGSKAVDIPLRHETPHAMLLSTGTLRSTYCTKYTTREIHDYFFPD